MKTLSQRSRRRLLRHHLVIGTICIVSLGVLYFSIQSSHAMFRLSMATAYLGLALLGATLVIGPMNVLRGRRNPLSVDLRRDTGIWCAIVSLAHVVVGLQVHLGSMVLYFFRATGDPQRWVPRFDVFGLTNYVGLAGTLLVVLLMALSNDASLRSLGRFRWKFLQRWNYAIAVLVVLHGVAYQILERRTMFFLVLFGAIVATMATVQLAGFLRYRQQEMAGPSQTQV
jgi:methionine sulfoxide reductase heme-binding subunit